MAVSFSGTFEVRKTPEEVFDFLTDPYQFAPMIPGFRELRVQDPAHFSIEMTVEVFRSKINADINMELAHADRPHNGHFKGWGIVSGEKVKGAASFELFPTAYGTKVNWQTEGNLPRWLASLADLFETTAKKQIQTFIDEMLAKLPQR
jgi:uncharacterized protein